MPGSAEAGRREPGTPAMEPARADGTDGSPIGVRRLLRRQLDHYPSRSTRIVCLAIVVATTILFYYQYYLISGVGAQVIAGTGMSFRTYVDINVLSALASALTSIAGGVTDRYGRANVVTVGVLGCALVCLLGFPLWHGTVGVGVLYGLLGALEGLVLVATPALVRDFSPQLGRATAMGFWTIGPVAGSLVVSAVVSNTIGHLHPWPDQYIIAGVVGLVVFAISALFLRELSPRLRNQVVVSEQDRLLVELRARGLDVEQALRRPFRQMLRLDILGSAVAVSLFLIIYFIAVGFFPIFFQATFGYSASQANALGDYMWGFQVLALVLIGALSDRLRVRKPFMVVGGLGAIALSITFIEQIADPHTSFTTFAVLLSLLALFLGIAFAPWMAGFTETVERRNPALSATGLALWGLVIRIVVTVSIFIGPAIVSTVTTLVDQGPPVAADAAGHDPALTPAQNAVVRAVVADPGIVTRAERLAKRYAPELATAQALSPSTEAVLQKDPGNTQALAAAVGQIAAHLHVTSAQALLRLVALGSVPASDLAFLAHYGPALENPKVQSVLRYLQHEGPVVQADQRRSVGQWQRYFWVAVAGQVVFLPLIFVMAGEWDPRRAREREAAHRRQVEAELARLGAPS